MHPRAPRRFNTRILVRYPGLCTRVGCTAIGTVRKGSLVGNGSTLNIKYNVVLIEGYVDGEAVQFVMIWFSSCVKDNFNVEAAGLSVGKNSSTSDCKASESSRECEQEQACYATSVRSDTLWRRR
jgi:hypothetical protein